MKFEREGPNKNIKSTANMYCETINGVLVKTANEILERRSKQKHNKALQIWTEELLTKKRPK
jgi:hypothetical protein